MRRTRKLRMRLVLAGTAGLAVVRVRCGNFGLASTRAGPDERRVREHTVGRTYEVVPAP
jgi:hypothetical protein